MLICTFFFAGLSFYHYHHAMKVIKSSERTEAVVESISRERVEFFLAYYVTIAFRANNGIEQKITTIIKSHPSSILKGECVSVIYPQDNPKEARFVLDVMYLFRRYRLFAVICFIISMLVFSLICVLRFCPYAPDLFAAHFRK